MPSRHRGHRGREARVVRLVGVVGIDGVRRLRDVMVLAEQQRVALLATAPPGRAVDRTGPRHQRGALDPVVVTGGHRHLDALRDQVEVESGEAGHLRPPGTGGVDHRAHVVGTTPGDQPGHPGCVVLDRQHRRTGENREPTGRLAHPRGQVDELVRVDEALVGIQHAAGDIVRQPAEPRPHLSRGEAHAVVDALGAGVVGGGERRRTCVRLRVTVAPVAERAVLVERVAVIPLEPPDAVVPDQAQHRVQLAHVVQGDHTGRAAGGATGESAPLEQHDLRSGDRELEGAGHPQDAAPDDGDLGGARGHPGSSPSNSPTISTQASRTSSSAPAPAGVCQTW